MQHLLCRTAADAAPTSTRPRVGAQNKARCLLLADYSAEFFTLLFAWRARSFAALPGSVGTPLPALCGPRSSLRVRARVREAQNENPMSTSPEGCSTWASECRGPSGRSGPSRRRRGRHSPPSPAERPATYAPRTDGQCRTTAFVVRRPLIGSRRGSARGSAWLSIEWKSIDRGGWSRRGHRNRIRQWIR